MMDIIWAKMKDGVLRQSLIEDFAGWTPEYFNRVHRTFTKEMFTILENKGIELKGKTFAEAFVRAT